MKDRTSSPSPDQVTYAEIMATAAEHAVLGEHIAHGRSVLAYNYGAAAAFGLMGMFEAIRENWLHVIPTDYSVMWNDENVGECEACGAPWEVVRPGKEQPTCSCDEEQRT